jgi:hypothetical protein
MRTDRRQTYMMKLTVAFRNFAIAPENKRESTFCLMLSDIRRSVFSLTVPNSPAFPFDMTSVKMKISMEHR